MFDLITLLQIGEGSQMVRGERGGRDEFNFVWVVLLTWDGILLGIMALDMFHSLILIREFSMPLDLVLINGKMVTSPIAL